MNWRNRCWGRHQWLARRYAFVGEPTMQLIVCSRCGEMRAIDTPQPR